MFTDVSGLMTGLARLSLTVVTSAMAIDDVKKLPRDLVHIVISYLADELLTVNQSLPVLQPIVDQHSLDLSNRDLQIDRLLFCPSLVRLKAHKVRLIAAAKDGPIPPCLVIEHLDLTGSELTTHALGILGAVCPRLRTITVTGCSVDATRAFSAQKIKKSFPRQQRLEVIDAPYAKEPEIAQPLFLPAY